VGQLPDGHSRRSLVQRDIVGLADEDVGELVEIRFDVEALRTGHVGYHRLTVDIDLETGRLAERHHQVCPRVDGQMERDVPETRPDADSNLVFHAAVLTQVDAVRLLRLAASRYDVARNQLFTNRSAETVKAKSVRYFRPVLFFGKASKTRHRRYLVLRSSKASKMLPRMCEK